MVPCNLCTEWCTIKPAMPRLTRRTCDDAAAGCGRTARKLGEPVAILTLAAVLALSLSTTSADALSDNVTTATTTTSTTTTITTTLQCAAVTTCFNNEQCAECLSRINATVGFPHAPVDSTAHQRSEARAGNEAFFQTLQSSTASCLTNETSTGLVSTALQSLLDNADSCGRTLGMVMTVCLVSEYLCFLDSNCRSCLAAMFAVNITGNITKADVLRSPACTATSFYLLIGLQNGCGGESFPTCSFYKQQCAASPECAACMGTLGAGDGAEAARQCPGESALPIRLLANVVNDCLYDSDVACSVWRQRCADNADCATCLGGMSNGDSLRAIATGWSTDACQRASQDPYTADYLLNIANQCPGISTCRIAVTNCVLGSNDGFTCISCINGSGSADTCYDVLQSLSLGSQCQPCSNSVHTINVVVFATAMVGAASAAACLVVVATIVAHGRENRAMRDRIIVGLMLANAVYSTANAIPLNALRTGILDCGSLAMSFDAIRFGRAWWFCGKYGLVGFELFILAASIRALVRGVSRVPPRAEAAMHAACCALAALAFAVFYARCASINADGYTLGMESEAYTNAFNHASPNDDLDDDEPSADASATFQRARDAYDSLVRDMLVAWDVLVSVAVGLWVVLRVVHRRALRDLRTETAEAARCEAVDGWADTRRSAWEARRRYLEAHRCAFNEVAKPLEPYIAVFVLFGAPAFVMSTRYCQNHSGANAADGMGVEGNIGGSTHFSYGTCDVWCEFVLAFRSLGAVAVYLVSRERRAEIVAVRATWRKLCTRVVGCVRCALDQEPRGYVPLDHDSLRGVEMDAFESLTNDDDNEAIDNNSSSATAAAIDECDVVKVCRLGEGAFGAVWVGELAPNGLRVAVKFLFAGSAVDDDGDLVDPSAREDFRRECSALQRVNSPHLIKFIGFGTTMEGNGFIVTELMLGGSLEDVLHNHKHDLPWRNRVAIGLQVALGMECVVPPPLVNNDEIVNIANCLSSASAAHAANKSDACDSSRASHSSSVIIALMFVYLFVRFLLVRS
jgi:hypothetical protein